MMEKYQIIPRKFRPKRFSEVASHEAIVTTLKNALTLGRVGQAYLFCGARGSGRTTQKCEVLFCDNRAAQNPTNDCESMPAVQFGTPFRKCDCPKIEAHLHRA